MDPFQPTKNKPGSLKWWGEIAVRFVQFMIAGFKEVIGMVRGRK